MLAFATIFGVGFAVLLISLIFGHDTDVHIDTDASSFGTDTHSPSIFSVKMISLLMVGFGAVGFGVRATADWSMARSSLAGIGGAAALGGIGYLILRMFYTSQASSTIGDDDILGSDANLIDAIIGSQYGQASSVIRGREITFLARSVDGQSIARNTPVRIVGKSGGVVTVKPVNPGTSQDSLFLEEK